jgi:hypothetical protein
LWGKTLKKPPAGGRNHLQSHRSNTLDISAFILWFLIYANSLSAAGYSYDYTTNTFVPPAEAAAPAAPERTRIREQRGL